MTVEIVECQPNQVSEIVDSLSSIYFRVFCQPPYSESPNLLGPFKNSIIKHAKWSGFSCLLAVRKPQDELIGFIYGYTVRPGQWWHDCVTRGLSPSQRERWFSDGFEIVDLALIPEERGHGIGGCMHDALLRRLPHQAALLSTIRAQTPALNLYIRRGWQVLDQNLLFPGVERTYLLLGKMLCAHDLIKD